MMGDEMEEGVMRWGWLSGDFLLAALEQAMAARGF